MALQRLEDGGIIISYYEGKTRIYQFNPSFPLLTELEQFLQKAYSLLSVHEKALYYVNKDVGGLNYLETQNLLSHIWNRLINVSSFSYIAKTKLKANSGWEGKGKGDVVVTRPDETSIVFQERGSWQVKGEGDPSERLDFTNIYRWTLDKEAGVIGLEHLRYGVNNATFLVHLIPVSSNNLSSIDSHMCTEDAYFAQLFINSSALRLHWRVIGPNKNEEMTYFYS